MGILSSKSSSLLKYSGSFFQMSSYLTPVTLADFLPKDLLCGDRGLCKLVCLWWHFNGFKIFAKAHVNPPEKEVVEEGERKSGLGEGEVGYCILK